MKYNKIAIAKGIKIDCNVIIAKYTTTETIAILAAVVRLL
jgi:hypothetical protein